MPQALPLCKYSSCDQVPADLQVTKPLAFLYAHTNSRMPQEPCDHPVNPQHEHPPCRTSLQSPRRAGDHTFVPFALLFPRGSPPVDALLGIHLITAVTGLS